jgi:hypothetical protein
LVRVIPDAWAFDKSPALATFESSLVPSTCSQRDFTAILFPISSTVAYKGAETLLTGAGANALAEDTRKANEFEMNVRHATYEEI